jgi:hypothetical protein
MQGILSPKESYNGLNPFHYTAGPSGLVLKPLKELSQFAQGGHDILQ